MPLYIVHHVFIEEYRGEDDAREYARRIEEEYGGQVYVLPLHHPLHTHRQMVASRP